MMKDCTIMTFLMTIIDSEAPETLCSAVGIFRNVPVTHYVHNWAVNRGADYSSGNGDNLLPKDVILLCRITFCGMHNCLLVRTGKAGLRDS